MKPMPSFFNTVLQPLGEKTKNGPNYGDFRRIVPEQSEKFRAIHLRPQVAARFAAELGVWNFSRNGEKIGEYADSAQHSCFSPPQ